MALSYESFYYPLGKGAATVSFKPKIDELKKKYFENIIKDIYVSCIYNKQKEVYTFFFKIPSENKEYPAAIMYDVILEFEAKKKLVDKDSPSIKDYNIYVFSNSPGFVFTFLYTLKHRYKAIAKCVPFNLLSKVALTKAPDVRNTQQLMTIEKTTWWALFHLDHNGYLNKENLATIISKENINHFLRKVSSQPMKLKEINEQKKLLKEEKHKLKELEERNKRGTKKDYKKLGEDTLQSTSLTGSSLKTSFVADLSVKKQNGSSKKNPFTFTFDNPFKKKTK